MSIKITKFKPKRIPYLDGILLKIPGQHIDSEIGKEFKTSNKFMINSIEYEENGNNKPYA